MLSEEQVTTVTTKVLSFAEECALAREIGAATSPDPQVDEAATQLAGV
jgi:hypothetical protein